MQARVGTGAGRAIWLAQALAKVVLDDRAYVLARSVLDGGPFAMRKAEELAELLVLQEGEVEDRGGDEKALE